METTNVMVSENNEKGRSSRTRKVLIEEAISNCLPEDKFNRFKVCEQLAEIMVSRYKGQNLEYHSERMGMETTSKMLKEIDSYFYKDFK